MIEIFVGVIFFGLVNAEIVRKSFVRLILKYAFSFCIYAKIVTLKSACIQVNWNWKKKLFWILYVWKRQTGITGLWTQELDAGLWPLDSGRWTLAAGLWTLDAGPWALDPGRHTLDTRLWTLDTVIVCFRTESEPSFWFCLIKLLKILWVWIFEDLMITLVL